jgi:hypothetical protein
VEPDRLAGATSSTNWPQEDVGSNKLLAELKFDSTIGISFLDTLEKPITASGSVSLYRSKYIPAFETPDSLYITFADQGSLVIDPLEFRKTFTDSADTIAFTMLIRVDSLQGLMHSLVYVVSTGKFSRLNYGHLSRITYPVSIPKFSVRGIPGSFLPKTTVSSNGKKGWCLYIPGTPFYFLINEGDMIDVGPIPQGDYPVRLLALGPAADDPKLQTLTVYEVKLTLVSSFWPSLEATKKIFEQTTKSVISIRF